MFNLSNEKSKKSKKRYRIGGRLRILTANALLADARFRNFIEQVQGYADLPAEHFDRFYICFIQRFAEFVQHLPDEPNAFLGTMLTNACLRGVNTLHIFATQYPHSTPLERFALFTAAALQDVSKAVIQQRVFITDDEGVTLNTWQPFCGPMTEYSEGSSYKLIPLSAHYQSMNKSIKTTLARQVMGELGFLWIADDMRLLSEWLEALNDEDEEGRGRLAHIIRHYRRSGGGLIDEFPLSDIELLDSPATEHADVFYDWLRKGLQNKTIKINTADAHVHMTDWGLFIEAGIFKDFCKLYYRTTTNQFVVFTQFGNLIGIASKGGGDYMHAQMFSDYPDASAMLSSSLSKRGHALKEGILIRDASNLYLKGEVPDSSPHLKASAALKGSVRDIAQFNQAKHNIQMKND